MAMKIILYRSRSRRCHILFCSSIGDYFKKLIFNLSMTSTGNLGEAAIKLLSVETFSKDCPFYSDKVFKVCAKFRVNLSSLAFYFHRSKVVDEVLEILDQISTSHVESNQESSTQQSNLPMTMIAFMKIRAHELRLSNWNGSIDKLSRETKIFLSSLSIMLFVGIRTSCSELGKLGYTMNNEELRVFNQKLLVFIFCRDF